MSVYKKENRAQSSAEVEEHDENKRIRVQISEKDLLCINGCGFYGTPQWGNRCSKCWRNHQLLEKRNLDSARNRTSFDSFQEKRRLSTGTGKGSALKNIWKSPNNLGSVETSPHSHPQKSPSRSRQLSPDSKSAREKLTHFLTRLSSSASHDVAIQTKQAVNKIHELRIAPDEISELVQQFYQYLLDKLNNNPNYMLEKHSVRAEEVLEEVETFVCISCYNHLFCANSDEEVADLSLQDRIRSLNWVTAGFLETKLDFSRQKVRDHLDDAISEMIDINSKRAASEKLDCLVKCSHKIFEALKESNAPTSADEFLPVLIYVLLKGNPPLIQSNLKFISRFALSSRVMSGESGYFFTNLSCALQFVQDMNHESLKMDRLEFESYTSGDLLPPLNIMNCGCNQALGSMERSLQRVRDLIQQQTLLSSKLEEIEFKLSLEKTDLDQDIKSLKSVYPSENYNSILEEIILRENETRKVCSLTSSRSSRETEDESASLDKGSNTTGGE
ncbi:unnamed protein product [Auanema sp. JU1783]|nr:unnamed protein product [Auanema sp. JU1783]